MPAAWEARNGPGSFRGAQFIVGEQEQAGGRKVVINEYPLRDLPFVEDLGRLGRAIEVNCFVSGSDYITKRDALRAALEGLGPAELVLPFEDPRLVQALVYRCREDQDRGIARFAISFYETQPKPFAPGVSVEPRSQLGASADKALTANVVSMSQYRALMPQPSTSTPIPGLSNVKPLPSFAFSRVTGLLQQATHAINKYMAPLVKGTQELAALKRATDDIITRATSLVRDPLLLAGQFSTLISWLASSPSRASFGGVPLAAARGGFSGGLLGGATSPRDGVPVLLATYRFPTAQPTLIGNTTIPPAPRPVATTATRAVEQANYDLLDAFIRRGVLVQAARLAADAADPVAVGLTPADGYQTHEEAVASRNEIVDAINEQLATADDQMYAALVQLRTDVINAVPSENFQLPRLTTFTPAMSLPSLVIAYRLYGDTDLADDLVSRNRIARPGFVPGGADLQVLTRV